MRSQRAFTLVELMVVVAVLAIIATLAAPSLRDFILMQRLKSINAQLVTDLQFARSEAVARNALMRVAFQSNSEMTCYSLYVVRTVDSAAANAQRCDCTLGANAACPLSTNMTELRTVQVSKALSVQVAPPALWPIAFAFDPITGGLMSIPLDNPSVPLSEVRVNVFIDEARTLRTVVIRTGRPTVCAPPGSTGAEAACPL